MAAGQDPSFYTFRTKDTPRLSLLLVILGVIFMNGNRASEGEWLDLQLGGCPPSHLRVLNSCIPHLPSQLSSGRHYARWDCAPGMIGVSRLPLLSVSVLGHKRPRDCSGLVVSAGCGVLD